MTDFRDRPTNEADGVAMLVDAYRRWATMPPAEVSVDRRDAYMAMGGLQLLQRHPALDPEMKAAFERVGRLLQVAVCDDPQLYVMAETGWDAQHDVEEQEP
ncbi:hypothetical protein [Streptosporangium sp. NPDC002721]|uniref:hypothetical protein n=1 Tax=Streptosporangium sp. NPDC002721 TaxID=3366188 RepID=UPI0036BA7B50